MAQQCGDNDQTRNTRGELIRRQDQVKHNASAGMEMPRAVPTMGTSQEALTGHEKRVALSGEEGLLMSVVGELLEVHGLELHRHLSHDQRDDTRLLLLLIALSSLYPTAEASLQVLLPSSNCRYERALGSLHNDPAQLRRCKALQTTRDARLHGRMCYLV